MVDLSSRLPAVVTDRLAALRSQVGSAVFSRVAGDEGRGRRNRILGADGPRWFAEDAAIKRVHGDASMFVGGLRALLLQSLHPLAMAGVAGHSGFRGDPWGRLQRTSYFLAATTFGPATEAERVIARITRAHASVRGVAPDGRPYSASDPHLLRWVHVAEIDSFLAAHDRYGSRPLDDAGRDAYVADTAFVARKLGVPDPPETVAELAAQIEAYRPELAGTPEARDAARFLLWEPPLPLTARVPYGVLAAASVGLLPRWARLPLRLPWLPVTEATVVRAGGNLITAGIRWVTSAPRDPSPPPMPPVHP
ncbi:oxygenase MpaB family protein [Pseudonocardia nematodicida]|uniref:Oxygenase MpaB family protein n=1 Tax=Pseudonocardia nematodicida TaxID=1206997 RepID=A0ABV1KCX1_9PSEU